MSKRVKSKATVTDSSDESEEEVKPKKSKTKAEKSSKASSSKTEEEDFSFPLSDKRKVSVREFKGKVYVDIREFYESDGKLRPGKKGIMLQLSQWEKLKNYVSDIDEAITELNG